MVLEAKSFFYQKDWHVSEVIVELSIYYGSEWSVGIWCRGVCLHI